MLIKVQLATGETAAARQRLVAVQAVAEGAGHAVWLMLTRAFLAVALYIDGDVERAAAELEQALDRLEAMALIGPLIECGAPMAALLRTALPRSARPDLIRSLLAAMGGADQVAAPAPLAAGRQTPDAALQPALEPLSERELDVLRLVATGASNQEIAGQLFIAITTVKKHVGNIFAKLGAVNRVQAVSRAQELKLL